jgi:hypothetical protein
MVVENSHLQWNVVLQQQWISSHKIGDRSVVKKSIELDRVGGCISDCQGRGLGKNESNFIGLRFGNKLVGNGVAQIASSCINGEGEHDVHGLLTQIVVNGVGNMDVLVGIIQDCCKHPNVAWGEEVVEYSSTEFGLSQLYISFQVCCEKYQFSLPILFAWTLCFNN